MKKIALALGLATTLAATQIAAAPTFTLAGGYAGPINMKFSNWENLTQGLAVGSQNFGMLQITEIRRSDNNGLLWSEGGANGFLGGIFAGITVASSASDGFGGLRTSTTGGFLDIYLNTIALDATQGLAGYATAGGGCVANQLCYNTISNDPNGTLFLSLQFMNGIDPNDGLITVVGNFDTTTFPTTGHAGSYLDVIGGTYAANFDADGQATPFGARDILIQDSFCPNGASTCGGPIGDWQLLSDDPAHATFMPEPATTTLLGLGLLGIAASLRRRKQ